ncbi:MAG: hypothetical protein QME96_13385 [Myxococcota bacterium]|nr:hypothetical protein [Myxococcota bacterium]
MIRPPVALILGWGALRSIARRAARPTGSLESLLTACAAERIRPLDAAAGVAAAAGASRCIACGRCDEAAPCIPAVHLPADWILARTRDPTDRDVAGAPPADAGAFEAMAGACPVGVPFLRMTDVRRSFR